jgi:hypothetical protein
MEIQKKLKKWRKEENSNRDKATRKQRRNKHELYYKQKVPRKAIGKGKNTKKKNQLTESTKKPEEKHHKYMKENDMTHDQRNQEETQKTQEKQKYKQNPRGERHKLY